MVEFAGARKPNFLVTYGPEPREKYGIVSKARTSPGFLTTISSGKT
jgi:hypothetical protein